jgi:hypothetical protein
MVDSNKPAESKKSEALAEAKELLAGFDFESVTNITDNHRVKQIEHLGDKKLTDQFSEIVNHDQVVLLTALDAQGRFLNEPFTQEVVQLYMRKTVSLHRTGREEAVKIAIAPTPEEFGAQQGNSSFIEKVKKKMGFGK